MAIRSWSSCCSHSRHLGCAGTSSYVQEFPWPVTKLLVIWNRWTVGGFVPLQLNNHHKSELLFPQSHIINLSLHELSLLARGCPNDVCIKCYPQAAGQDQSLNGVVVGGASSFIYRQELPILFFLFVLIKFYFSFECLNLCLWPAMHFLFE